MPTPDRPRRPDAGDGLFILGLVGRAGSGKSTVARALAASGAVLIEADAIGHEVTARDPEVRSALIAEYGPGVYGPDGALDRPQVAARVFSDAGETVGFAETGDAYEAARLKLARALAGGRP